MKDSITGQFDTTDLLREDLIINGTVVTLYIKAWNSAYNVLYHSGLLQNMRALSTPLDITIKLTIY